LLVIKDDPHMEALLPAAMSRAGLIDALNRSRQTELLELHRAYRPDRYLSLIGAWAAAWLRAVPRLHVPAPSGSVAAREVAITFVGHATVLFRFPQLSVVVDPMLGTHLGLVRRAAVPDLSPRELECDLILITNAGMDHLHPPTLAQLPRTATLVVPPRGAALVSSFGFARVLELGAGASVSQRGVDVTNTPVKFGAAPACGYVLRGDGPSVFICGESGYFSGFAEIGDRHRPDIAVLPIGGYVPRSFRAEHMSPLDAIFAFEDLGARLLIPIRYGAFALSYEKLGEPLRWLRRLVADRELERHVAALAPGESRKFIAP
jgi:L-ascorbate metabolism protein UlaG (beta-lactamase superfamily)